MRSQPVARVLVLDEEAAGALLDPLRRRLLDEVRRRPASAVELSRRLEQPRQRLNYHLRELERLGLVELDEERRRGNCTERVLRASARHFLLDPALVDELAPGPGEARDRFSASYLMGLTARAAIDVARLESRAEAEGRRLATMAIETQLSLARPADLEAFSRDLADAVAKVVAAHHDEEVPGGRSFRLVMGMYPGNDGPPGRRQADGRDVNETEGT